tara:strand:+ start:1367 stop:1642 length:276 start_codon:yes stop_codon:yes gene_type:complete
MKNMEARFDKLELKLDKMGESLTKLTEIDTKLDHFSQHNTTQDKRLDAHSERLDKLNSAVIRNSGASRIAERLFFVILIAGISFISYTIRG